MLLSIIFMFLDLLSIIHKSPFFPSQRKNRFLKFQKQFSREGKKRLLLNFEKWVHFFQKLFKMVFLKFQNKIEKRVCMVFEGVRRPPFFVQKERAWCSR
jgi:hypothetical protein